jgi:hypothetical protein
LIICTQGGVERALASKQAMIKITIVSFIKIDPPHLAHLHAWYYVHVNLHTERGGVRGCMLMLMLMLLLLLPSRRTK